MSCTEPSFVRYLNRQKNIFIENGLRLPTTSKRTSGADPTLTSTQEVPDSAKGVNSVVDLKPGCTFLDVQKLLEINGVRLYEVISMAFNLADVEIRNMASTTKLTGANTLRCCETMG